MFKIDLSPTFWAPVRFEAPAPTGHQRQVHEFSGQFPRMTVDELEALGQKAAGDAWPDRQVAAHLLRGWSDVADQHGNALPFTPDNVTAVLNVAGVAAAVVAAFRAAQPRAALGN